MVPLDHGFILYAPVESLKCDFFCRNSPTGRKKIGQLAFGSGWLPDLGAQLTLIAFHTKEKHFIDSNRCKNVSLIMQEVHF